MKNCSLLMASFKQGLNLGLESEGYGAANLSQSS